MPEVIEVDETTEKETPPPPVSNLQIIKFSVTDAAIAELKQQYSGLQITDTASYEVVRSALSTVRTKRTDVEKTRKDLKASALSFGRKVDNEAKRITALLLPIEEALKATKQAEDDKKEAIKQEAEKKEKERVGEIYEKVKAVRDKVLDLPGLSSDKLKVLVQEIDAIEITEEEYQEFFDSAKEAKDLAMDHAANALWEKLNQEQEAEEQKKEAKRLETERAELENQKREEAEKQAKIRAEQEAREKAEADRLEKIRLEQEKEQEKLKEERLKIEAEKAEMAAAKKAEEERIEAENKAKKEKKEREEFEKQTKIKLTESARFEELKAIGFTYPLDDLGNMSDKQYSKMYTAHKTAWDELQNGLFLEKLKKEREEKERKEAKEKAKQEALKPDKEKLEALALKLGEIELPKLKDQKAKAIISEVKNKISDIQKFIIKKGEEL